MKLLHGLAMVSLALALSAGCRRSPAPSKDTYVTERPFKMTLPGPWKREAEPGALRWVYRSDRYRAKLTVTVTPAQPPLTPDKVASALDAIVEQHRAAQTAAGGETLQLSEAMRTTSGQVLAARVDGLDERAPRWSSALFLVSPTGAAVFFYEAEGKRDDTALRRAWEAFDSIVVK